jgi:glycosyltransferase involved in cell wall biosynthesis
MKQHKLFYGSSYDRGLDFLLKMWPDIKNKFPDATLDICYGWDLFDKATQNNEERREWKERVVEMMSQVDITHHGRVGKKELEKIRKECGILAYPAYFTEINCITVLESMKDGLVPVTTDLAALSETNDCGVEDTKQPEPLVSIVTPTIRRGFWNIMANNIANQTYKNIEWIIVDDYKDDRSNLALEYAKKYNLTIRYVRGKKRAIKRTYGLVNANNTGLQEAKGELMVILQDFIIMPERGIEMLIDVYRRNSKWMV